jgi:choline dehydrogenase-like flavoprotein
MPLGGLITTNHISEDTRERSHAGCTYLTLAGGRTNLHVETSVHVEKIKFRKTPENDYEATDVIYWKNGEQLSVKARKQVIISARVFGSPQLLELSGFGSAAVLHSHGIEVLYENNSIGGTLLRTLKYHG